MDKFWLAGKHRLLCLTGSSRTPSSLYQDPALVPLSLPLPVEVFVLYLSKECHWTCHTHRPCQINTSQLVRPFIANPHPEKQDPSAFAQKQAQEPCRPLCHLRQGKKMKSSNSPLYCHLRRVTILWRRQYRHEDRLMLMLHVNVTQKWPWHWGGVRSGQIRKDCPKACLVIGGRREGRGSAEKAAVGWSETNVQKS